MEIKIYSASYCPNCETLKKWMRNNFLDYTEINIEKDFRGKAILLSKGFMGIPVIQKDGEFKAGSVDELIEFIK